MTSENLRESTIIRYRFVRREYEKVINGLGNYACLVPKSYIYEEVMRATGLSARTISRAMGGR